MQKQASHSYEDERVETSFSHSAYKMIDVGHKQATFRRAIAQGKIHVGNACFALIKKRQLPKGDALALAEVAGIMGAKKVSDTVPLCHPLPLNHIRLDMELHEEDASICVYCMVSAYAKTGVEMEALAGVNAALLAIYDLSKMIEPGLAISDVRLLTKEGGKKGLWIHPYGIPENIEKLLPKEQSTKQLEHTHAAIITISDRASQGTYGDEAGPLLKELLEELGCSVNDYAIIPDDKARIINHIKTLYQSMTPQLILTTGGTGLSPTDVTPEAIAEICDRQIPGLAELLRHDGAKYMKYAWLSRSIAGIFNKTLIITLPGNPNAIRESIDILKELLPHALKIITGAHHD